MNSNLEGEISQYKDEAQKQRKIIYQLEKERDRYISEASDLTQKVLQNMEEIKVNEFSTINWKRDRGFELREAKTLIDN